MKPVTAAAPAGQKDLPTPFTTAEQAIGTILHRRKDPALLNRVLEYLGGDVLPAFSGSSPVFYLARHLATPSFETQQAIGLARDHGLNLVIGEDTRSIFVTQNPLKLALGRLPLVRGMNRNNAEIIVYDAIVDLPSAQGKPMSQIQTRFGANLPGFHAFLMANSFGRGATVVDEADWIDRNCRTNIFEQYKRTLALTCAHAIMIEWFAPEEYQFGREVFLPAFEAVTNEIGVCPLIVQLATPEADSDRNWNAYPEEVVPLVKTFGKRTTGDAPMQEELP